MADDQKIENLLNLALGATAEERRKSPELMVGYDEEDQRWDIIVKYLASYSGIAKFILFGAACAAVIIFIKKRALSKNKEQME